MNRHILFIISITTITVVSLVMGVYLVGTPAKQWDIECLYDRGRVNVYSTDMAHKTKKPILH